MNHANVQRGRVTRWNILAEMAERERVGAAVPTVRELADMLYVNGSHGSMGHQLRTLRSRGLVTWETRKARTMHLTPEGRAFVVGIWAVLPVELDVAA